MTLVLGEMDVARVRPYRSDQGTPLLMAWFVPQQSAAATQLRGRHLVRHIPDGRHPPGADYVERRGMRDDVWRGQKEGSMKVRTGLDRQ